VCTHIGVGDDKIALDEELTEQILRQMQELASEGLVRPFLYPANVSACWQSHNEGGTTKQTKTPLEI
jgi:hypothetical protein